MGGLGFLKLWFSLLLNMEINKKTLKEQKVKRQKRKKDHIQWRNRIFVQNSLSTNIQFSSEPTPLLDVLNLHLIPLPLCNFGILSEIFNNKTNIVTYRFFFATAYSIYFSRIYNKTDWQKSHQTTKSIFVKVNVSVIEL